MKAKLLFIHLLSGVNFINIFRALFSYQSPFLAAFPSYILALVPKFCTKNACVNVDEIETSITENSCYVGRLKNIKIAIDIPKGCLLHMRLVSWFLNTLGEK